MEKNVRTTYYQKKSCMLYDDFAKIEFISDLEMRNEFKQFPTKTFKIFEILAFSHSFYN